MILTDDILKCCGCRACEEVCPLHCINMSRCENGFFYPIKDTNKCIGCGACERVCPYLETKVVEPMKEYVAFAKNKNTRKNGSSGGIFGLIAEWMIKNNGMVFGAGFNDELKLMSMSVETLHGLESLYRSKYLQADMKGSYSRVKNELENGRWVLFCSTPCNVQALRNYLGKEYRRLILVDFVCHGVASQELFDKSVSWYEEKYKKRVVSFDFRNKEHRINCSRVFSALMDDKTEVKGTYLDFPHYFLYMKQISMRPSCYSCKFARSARCSDITIGDFHMPEKYIPKKERLSGLSSVICNTKKGYKVIQELMLEKTEVDIDEIVRYNEALRNPTINEKQTKFLEDYSLLTFDKLLEQYGYFSLKTKVKRIYYKLPRFVQEMLRRVLIKE